MKTTFEQVREAIDLQTFLESETGAHFHNIGGVPRSDTCPCCGHKKGSNRLALLKGNKRWRCFTCGNGGDIVDAASKLWSMTLKDAVKKLSSDFWVTNSVKIDRRTPEKMDEAKATRQRAMQRALKLLQKEIAVIENKDAFNYLLRRGLSGKLVSDAIRKGMLGFLPSNQYYASEFLKEVIGSDLMIEAGLLKPENRVPAISYRPVVFFMPEANSAEFRKIKISEPSERKALRYGTSPRPWFWSGELTKKTVAVVEGAVDLLSLIEYGFKGDIIGLPGASVWRPEWFQGYEKVITALDKDEAGMKNTLKIMQTCESMGIKAVDKTPPEGDINDMLLRRLGLKV